MTFLVPVVLGGIAVAVMTLVSIAAARRSRQTHVPTGAYAAAARILVHSINDDRCTGCDACVAVCPTNVLDLVDNKSRVLRFQDCIQCEACMWACPTTALVMHPEGTHPPAYRMPDLDEHYQTRVPGQYLIGEVAGKPLVKNAANLGRAVIEHMLRTGLRPGKTRGGRVDVAIVGSGPGGLAAALSCIQRGLSYVCLEKENIIASTVARYPKGKLIMAEPYDTENLSLLPVFDSGKEETIPIWEDLIARTGLAIKMGETVEGVIRRPDGDFDIRTNVAAYQAQRVVLATGTRGKPRTLGVAGENLPKVASLLEDPDHHRGQTVCVVGGGDSALEAAIALADAGARVILSYRARSFSRAAPKNRQTVERYEAERRLKVKYQSEVVDIAGDTITLQMSDGTQKRYPNQATFVLIGADPPIEWLATLGIHFIERPHLYALPKSDDLIRRFLGNQAAPCPENAAGAAALVQGRPIEEVLRDQPVRAESRHKKWIRSATAIFSSGGKLEKPMPLSEFAKQSRRHDGRGRRDQLDARERTRVLRMLRDEGGRQADEDSKLYVIDRGRHERSDVAIVPQGSPPPWSDDDLAPPPRPEFPIDSPLRTLPPLDRSLRTLPPNDPGSPRPAVIVGLARAAAQAPPRKRPASRPPGRALPPPFPPTPARGRGHGEERTEHLQPEQARALVRESGGPRPVYEEPTQLESLDALALDDESTRQVQVNLPATARPEEPTMAVDVRSMAPLEAANPREHDRARDRRGNVHEEATRAVDLSRGSSISDIDWDID